MLKRTAFYEKHIEAGGKIVPFAGFEMPIQYKGIIHEVKRVRTTVGVFDVSHMGRIEISNIKNQISKIVEDFVNRLTTNDISRLAVNQAQYSCMCYEDGGIVDDLVVYKQVDKFLLVVNGANREKDYNWMFSHKPDDVIIRDVSDGMAQLAIQGPQAEPALQPIVDISLSNIKYYWGAYCKIDVGGVQLNAPTFITRTGYTGEDGFEFYFDSKYAHQIWDKVMESGRKFDIEPIGLGARDVLRLEMKYCLYGNDMDETTTPLCAGLGWITKLDKPDFIGKSALIKQKEEGIKRKLVAFVMESKAIPRQHYYIYYRPHCHSERSEESSCPRIGIVTSGNFSPSINQPIGLGYVNIPYDKVDTEIYIDCRGKLERAKIISSPFYKHATHK